MIEDNLPQPDSGALAHSRDLQSLMLREYHDVGQLPFSRFMHLALHAPGYGYYSAGNTKFGANGDFVTAPETSVLFAECIAEQLVQVFSAVDATVLEVGAGSGQLALGVLTALNRQPCELQHYWILETSADLIDRQRRLLETALPAEVFVKVEWLTELPNAFSGVVIANEVLDAMPVECVEVTGGAGAFLQRFVEPTSDDLSAGGEIWSDNWQSANALLSEVCRNRLGEYLEILPAGYRTEVNLQMDGWFYSLGQSLKNGLVLIIDYGYPRRELYTSDRSEGTLRCYYRHRLHDDPLFHPGLQDITADVDFTYVVEAASDAGFDLHGYTSQAQFLLANGLTEKAESRLAGLESGADRERFLIAQQVNTLSMASAMGERFQVMGLSKGLELPLRGFQALDLSYRL